MYTIIPTKKFKEDIKYYESKKKFKHIIQDIGTLVKELSIGNLIGDEIPGLHLNDENNKIIKVRIANTDTQQGKANGYRLIYYAIKEDMTVYLLSIYYKKDNRKIPEDDEIINLVKKYCC